VGSIRSADFRIILLFLVCTLLIAAVGCGTPAGSGPSGLAPVTSGGLGSSVGADGTQSNPIDGMRSPGSLLISLDGIHLGKSGALPPGTTSIEISAANATTGQEEKISLKGEELSTFPIHTELKDAGAGNWVVEARAMGDGKEPLACGRSKVTVGTASQVVIDILLGIGITSTGLEPAAMTVPVGATVIITNHDDQDHRVLLGEGGIERKVESGKFIEANASKAGKMVVSCVDLPSAPPLLLTFQPMVLLGNLDSNIVAPGQDLVLSGTGFGDRQNEGAVLLGKRRVQVSSWSDQEITCRVPADFKLGRTDVELSLPTGPSNRLALTIGKEEPPSPSPAAPTSAIPTAAPAGAGQDPGTNARGHNQTPAGSGPPPDGSALLQLEGRRSGADSMVLSLKLTRDLEMIGGVAFILVGDPPQNLKMIKGGGRDGVEAGGLFSQAQLMVVPAAGSLEVGIVETGRTGKGPGELARFHLRSPAGPLTIRLQKPRITIKGQGEIQVDDITFKI